MYSDIFLVIRNDLVLVSLVISIIVVDFVIENGFLFMGFVYY